jgi:uncharacterized protein YgiM (DUF1202 family)
MALLCAYSVAAAAADIGYAVRAIEVKVQPATDASTVFKAEANEALEVQHREGAWMLVKSKNGRTGWVRMLSLRMTGRGSTSATKSLFQIARASTGGPTVTTGVRGLNEIELESAKPNAAAIKRLDGYAVSASGAKKFAGAEQLKPRKIDYLPEPDQQ